MNSDFSRSHSRSNSHSSSPGYIRLGRFELLKRLAAGGMAEIFLAREFGSRGYEKAVAIKRIHPHLAEQERFVEMFLQEAKIAQRLDHENIVRIVELGEADGEFFIAMEYVLGCSLRQLMRDVAKQQRDVPIEVCVEMILQSCAGLHEAHELRNHRGTLIELVHRDISPHNLMLTYEGEVKLLDFGIAKAKETMLEATRTGVLKGKLHYMSPEQCRQSRDLDRRSDIFSLGIVLWELFTGRRLFKRESDLETMQSIVSGKIWDVREFRPDVPDEIAEVVNKALKVDREDRFTSSEDMRKALKIAAENSGINCSKTEIVDFIKTVFGETMVNERAEIEEILDQSQHEKSLSLLNDRSFGQQHHIARSSMSQSKKFENSLILQKTTRLFEASEGSSQNQNSHQDNESSATKNVRPSAQGALIEEDTNFIRHQKHNTVMIFVVLLVSTLLSFLLVTSGLIWFFADAENKTEQDKSKSDQILLTETDTVVKMVWPPVFESTMLLADLQEFKLYLEEKLKKKVVFEVATSYDSLNETLSSGKADFAWMPPYLLLKAIQEDPKADIILSSSPAKRRNNYAILIAKNNEKNMHLDAFVGQTFCYPDKSSTSGYLFATHYFRKLGFSAKNDFKMHRSGNHLQVLEDIKNGVCRFGGSYSGVFEFAKQHGVKTDRLEKIAQTGLIQAEMIVASPSVSKELKTEFRDVLLALDKEAAQKMSALNIIRGFEEKDLKKIEKMSQSLSRFEKLSVQKPKKNKKKRRHSKKHSK